MPVHVNVTADTSILAIHSEATKEDIDLFIQKIIHWTRLLDAPWADVRISERAAEDLITHKFYPLDSRLDSLFEQHGIVEFAVNDIRRVVSRILEITPYFEDVHAVSDILIDKENFSQLLYCDDSMRSSTVRIIAIIIFLYRFCPNNIIQNFFITNSNTEKSISCDIVVEIIEHARNDIPDIEYPLAIEGAVTLYSGVSSIIRDVEFCSLIQKCATTDDLRVIINLFVEKCIPSIEGKVPNNFTFNDCFITSYKHIVKHMPSSFIEKSLRALKETILKENLSAVHALRENSGGNSKQIFRVQDKAWRRDIDDEYHLHYWECANGFFEFASVSPHNIFSIPK